MPKTKTKKSTGVKASSSKGLKKRFDLRSRKVQFFVTIAIVALLGGGWFTYKSFAATILFQPKDNTLACVNYCQKKSDVSKNGDGSKSTITILSLDKIYGYAKTSDRYLRGQNTQYRVCITGRRETANKKANLNVYLRASGSNKTIARTSLDFNWADYSNYLTQCRTFDSPVTYSGNHYLQISNNQAGDWSRIYVSTASIYKLGDTK